MAAFTRTAVYEFGISATLEGYVHTYTQQRNMEDQCMPDRGGTELNFSSSIEIKQRSEESCEVSCLSRCLLSCKSVKIKKELGLGHQPMMQ